MRHLISILVLAWPLLASAQTEPAMRLPLEAGDSIRVQLRSGDSLQASFVRQTADSIAVRHASANGTAITMLSLQEITSVEMSVGHHSAQSAAEGLGIGLISGLAVGATLAHMEKKDCSRHECLGAPNLLVGFFAFVGTVTGALLGAFHSTNTWELVWRPERTAP